MKQVLSDLYTKSEKTIFAPSVEQTQYLVWWELQEASGISPLTTPLTIDGNLWYIPSLNAPEAWAILQACDDAYASGTWEWPMMSIEQRCDIMKAFAEDMKNIKNDVVPLLMAEIGKNKNDATKEFDRTITYIMDTIEAAKKHKPIIEEHPDWLKTKSDKMPLGPTLCMSPFNYPLNETFTTFIPALVMGNTTILKPAKHGIGFWKYFLPLFQKHFPAWVVNTIYGDGKTIIEPIMSAGKIKTLAFIGSASVGNRIISYHPKPEDLRVVNWYGAKNAYIIDKTTDIKLAIRDVLMWSLSYNGQRCTAAKMILVDQEIADVFTQWFVQAVEELKIGMPYGYYTTVLDPQVYTDPTVIPNITPLPEYGKIEAMHEYINDAISKWAQILNKNGWDHYHKLMVPAILWGVTSDMKIYHEEQFGPVVPIVTYKDPQEAINWVKNSLYGQQLSVYTENPQMEKYFCDNLNTQVGRVNINSVCQRGPDKIAFSATKGSATGTLSIDAALLKFSKDRVLAKFGSFIIN
jgi:glyceraldehyde-3-phosphate dehydrogenase (NADP+)